MKNKNKIMMPVIAIFDGCYSCPELEIEIAQKELHVHTDGELWGNTIYDNTLYCKHYERCRLLKSSILDNAPEDKVDQI